jgi:hypothetical protein
MKINTIALAALSLLLILLVITFYLYRATIAGHFYGNSDFFGFYQSVRFYFSGQNLYSPTLISQYLTSSSVWISADGNLNPPFFTLLLLPFYFLNYADALKTWTMISLFLALLSVFLALRPFPRWHKNTLLIMLGFLIYLQTSVTLAFGQVTHYLLILITAAWLLGREKKDISAGILIGMACAIKFFCGLFLIYFLCIKRFKLFLSSVMTALFCFGLSLLVFGAKNYLSYQAVLKKIAWYASSWNVSFLGFFSRLFSFSEKNQSLYSLPWLTKSLTLGLSAFLVIYLVLAWRTLTDKKEPFDRGFGLVIIAMILLSPLGWTYYFGLFLIPYLILVHQSNNDHIHLASTFLLFLSMLSGKLLHAQEIKTLTQILYFGGMGFYVLVAFLGLYLYAFQKRFSFPQASAPMPRHLWFLIYIAALMPSLFSLGSIFKNLSTF